MTKIDLLEFTHYSRKQLQEFLSLETDCHFDIYFPRMRSIDKSISNTAIYAWQYCLAAYYGELLSKQSNSFCYMVPGIYSDREFYFCLVTDEPEKLANILNRLLQELSVVPDKRQALRLAAYGFYERALKVRARPVCIGLLELGRLLNGRA